MWSDTSSYDFNSKGDLKKSRNLDAFNLAGPNMSPIKKNKETFRSSTGNDNEKSNQLRDTKNLQENSISSFPSSIESF